MEASHPHPNGIQKVLSKVRTESFSWYCKRGSSWQMYHCSNWPRLYLLSPLCCPPSMSQHCNFSKFISLFLLAKTLLYLFPHCFHLTTFRTTPPILIESHSPHSISPWRWRQHIPPKHSYPSIRLLCYHEEDHTLNSHHSVHLKIYSNQSKFYQETDYTE
jgi:hypothetical protein